MVILENQSSKKINYEREEKIENKIIICPDCGEETDCEYINIEDWYQNSLRYFQSVRSVRTIMIRIYSLLKSQVDYSSRRFVHLRNISYTHLIKAGFSILY